MLTRRSAFKSIQWKPVDTLRLAGDSEAFLLASKGSKSLLEKAQEKFGIPRAASPGARAIAPVPEQPQPSVLGPKDSAVELLHAAAEIEHQLLVEYLYAAYSLVDTSPRPDLVPDTTLRQWRGTLIGVAKEEMGHLLTVQNLLLCLDAAPYLGRISPASEGHSPFPFRLEPLSLVSLAKYVSAETPDPNTLDLATRNRAQPAYDLAKSSGFDITPVGLLYAHLYWLFQSGDGTEGPWALKDHLEFDMGHLSDDAFQVSNLEFQGSSDDWLTDPALPAQALGIFVSGVGNRAQALQALHDISAQGEGLTSSLELDSHFMRFLKLYEDIPRNPENPGQILAGLVRPFPTDPVYGPQSAAAPPDRRITDPTSIQWCEQFDLQYHLLLAEIALSLRMNSTMANNGRSTLASLAIMSEMKSNIAGIARTLGSLPRSQGIPIGSACAAPPFTEIDFPTDMRSAPAVAIWAKELVDASNRHVASMRASGLGSGADVFHAPGSNDALDSSVLQPILNPH